MKKYQQNMTPYLKVCKVRKFKKHYTHLTTYEYSTLEYFIGAMDFRLISDHFYENIYDRLKLKGVDMSHLDDMLTDIKTNYTIIEVHNENNSNNTRVLVRGNKSFDNGNLCLVFCLKRKIVVTGYINMIKDNHKTIDFSRYHNIDYNFLRELR